METMLAKSQNVFIPNGKQQEGQNPGECVFFLFVTINLFWQTSTRLPKISSAVSTKLSAFHTLTAAFSLGTFYHALTLLDSKNLSQKQFGLYQTAYQLSEMRCFVFCILSALFSLVWSGQGSVEQGWYHVFPCTNLDLPTSECIDVLYIHTVYTACVYNC